MDKKDNRGSEREPEGNSFDYEELVGGIPLQTMDDPGVCGNDDPGDPDLHSAMEIKQP